jgi:nucleoside-diphosphate-sugar epimerase
MLMKVFVAGASGAIGRPLVRELVRRGHEVTAMSTTAAKRPDLEALGATPALGDVFDAQGTAELVRSAHPEGVINVASKWSVYPTRLSQVRPANEIRERGARNMVAAAVAAGARRFVNESMMFVYGYGDHPEPITEDQPAGRERSRGLQRVIDAISAAEGAVLERSSRGDIEGACMRFGLFHGPHAESTRRMFELVRKRRLPLIAGGAAVRSWIELEDAANAVADALERAPAGSVYNVVDDEPVSMADYIGEIVRLTGSKPPRGVPYWLIAPGASYIAPALGRGRLPISNAKLKADLDWSPRYPTYREALRGVAETGEAPA